MQKMKNKNIIMKLILLLSISMFIGTCLSQNLDDNNCYWSGKAPFCNGKCQNRYSVLKTDKYGDGKKCATGNKVYCCFTP